MTPHKIKIAFFASTFNSDSNRGASRLFSALINTLSKRNDVELYELLDRLPSEFNPIDSIFRIRQFGKERGSGPILNFVTKYDRFKTLFKKAQTKYRTSVPNPIRYTMRPFTFIPLTVLRTFDKRIHPFISKLREKIQQKNIFLREVFFPRKTSSKNNNEYINAEYVDINEFDVILNFWWFHTPSSNESTGLSKNKAIVYSWFLDAIPLRIPHWQEGLISESVFRNNVQTHLEMSDRVVAISHSAAEDAHLLFSIPREKTIVIPCGLYANDFIKRKKESQFEKTLKKYGVKENVPIILSIGLQEPSKNTINIIKSCYNLIISGNKNFQLIIVGEHRGMDPLTRFGAVLKKISESINIVFTGSISEDDKQALMSAADLFLYPSLWEGFGIPPLEAMAAGIPVIVSDVASLPEVCKDYVLYCDPYDPSDISEKITTVLEMSPESRISMLNRAREYAKEWLWEKKAVPELIADIRNQLPRFSSNKNVGP